MATYEQLNGVSLAWRNSCMEELGAIRGGEIAMALDPVLVPDRSGSRILGDAKRILAIQELRFGTVDALARRLTADWYRVTASQGSIAGLASGGRAFDSMASFTNALRAAVSEVEAIEAGRVPAPDIADLMRIDPEVLEAEAVRLGADPEEAEIMVAGIWHRLSQVIAQARVQLETKRVRQMATAQMLEETRLAS